MMASRKRGTYRYTHVIKGYTGPPKADGNKPHDIQMVRSLPIMAMKAYDTCHLSRHSRGSTVGGYRVENGDCCGAHLLELQCMLNFRAITAKVNENGDSKKCIVMAMT